MESPLVLDDVESSPSRHSSPKSTTELHRSSEPWRPRRRPQVGRMAVSRPVLTLSSSLSLAEVKDQEMFGTLLVVLIAGTQGRYRTDPLTRGVRNKMCHTYDAAEHRKYHHHDGDDGPMSQHQLLRTWTQKKELFRFQPDEQTRPLFLLRHLMLSTFLLKEVCFMCKTLNTDVSKKLMASWGRFMKAITHSPPPDFDHSYPLPTDPHRRRRHMTMRQELHGKLEHLFKSPPTDLAETTPDSRMEETKADDSATDTKAKADDSPDGERVIDWTQNPPIDWWKWMELHPWEECHRLWAKVNEIKRQKRATSGYSNHPAHFFEALRHASVHFSGSKFFPVIAGEDPLNQGMVMSGIFLWLYRQPMLVMIQEMLQIVLDHEHPEVSEWGRYQQIITEEFWPAEEYLTVLWPWIEQHLQAHPLSVPTDPKSDPTTRQVTEILWGVVDGAVDQSLRKILTLQNWIDFLHQQKLPKKVIEEAEEYIRTNELHAVPVQHTDAVATHRDWYQSTSRRGMEAFKKKTTMATVRLPRRASPSKHKYPSKMDSQTSWR